MEVNIGQGLMNAGLYLGIPLVLSTFVAMFMWERTCRTKTRVIVIKAAGGSENLYADKEGSEVTIPNKALGVTRTWPINSLATFPTSYPELGILPKFLQREIQTVIVNENDWEPVSNRSPHRTKIMSPDAVEFLRDIADKYPAVADSIDNYLEGVATGPTREMIADPAILGALKASSVMKALASVSDDLLEALKGIRNQLARFAGLNATIVYIGLGLVVVLQGFIIYQMYQTGGTDIVALNEKVDAIMNALGITNTLGVK
jgi:hypothetical protein